MITRMIHVQKMKRPRKKEQLTIVDIVKLKYPNPPNIATRVSTKMNSTILGIHQISG